ncbi:lipopolysaccharide biosynthesis protein [Salinirubrum litoreum]|uniref:Lipopolysaccharide biosynthesis protein n=1 Tax=Salinirubrum litoreum TaxID=1126234 RepID=A0ABD5RFQ8_9EURY|nr:oligosaccharide flippase family protein [Salinirubrum litoreum]
MNPKKILSDTSVSLVRSVIVLVRGLILIPIITKISGAGAYGIWTVVLSIVTVIVTVGSVHSHGTLVRYADSSESAREVGSEVLFISLGGVALVTLLYIFTEISVGIASIQPTFQSQGLFLLSLSFLILGESLFSVLKNIPRAQGRVKVYELLWISRKVVEVTVLGAIFSITSDIVIAIVAMGVVIFLFDVALFLKFKMSLHVPSRARFKKYLHYGTPMIPKELSGTLLSHGDKFIILYFLSPTAVGIYAVSYSVSKTIYALSGVMNSTLYPSVTSAWDEDDRNSIRNLYTQILRIYTIIALPAIVGMTLLAEPVLKLISTESVAGTGGVLLPLLAVGFLIYGYSSPLMYILHAAEQNTKVGFITTIAMIMNIALNLILVPNYELLGAVAATILSFTAITTYVGYSSWSKVKFSIPIKAGTYAVVGTVVMTVILLAIPVQGPLQVVVYPTLGAPVYFVIVFLVGGIKKQELTWLKKTIL